MFEYFDTTTFTSRLCPEVSYKLKKMSKGRRSAFDLKIAGLIVEKTKLQKALIPISDEIARAEEEAKIEPCSCAHSLADEFVANRVLDIKEQTKNLPIPIQIIDACHSSTTKRCIIDGCSCRKPKPDPKIGGYVEYQDIISQLMDLEANKIGIERMRFFVDGIQGLKILGQDATVDLMISDGPEALVDELSHELNKLLTLSPEDALGFKQPTTGGVVVENQESITDQPTAAPANKADSTSNAAAVSISPI